MAGKRVLDSLPLPTTEPDRPAPPAAAAPLQGVRTLVPIVHFDMVGYSGLIGFDDAGTLARIQSLRNDLFDPLIARHGGTVAQTAGDSLLVLFGSVLEAVACAASVQRRVPGHRTNATELPTIRFRVGIAIGDVIADRNDLHGEGVIVAVRLESACPPGAICISRGVWEHVEGRIAAHARPVGPLTLKNVARKVEAVVLEVEPEPACGDPGAGGPDRRAIGSTPSVAPFGIFGDRAAIAVLPFRCSAAGAEHGNDGAPEGDPVADALTDDLIHALSAWRCFPVIARQSSFSWRGREADMRLIGRELGARYIVSGSIRRRGSGLRMMVQLADVETGETLLSETHDHGDGAAGLDVPGEIVRGLAGVLAPEVLKLERERASRRHPAQASVDHLLARGMWHRFRTTREDHEIAEALFREALELDPHHARARAALAIARNFAAVCGWAADREAALAECLELARRAVADDARYPDCHYALGVACMNIRRVPEAFAELHEAVRLNPSHAYARANLGQVLNYLNCPKEGLAEVQLAMRLNPHDPRRFHWLAYVAASHYLAGRYKVALAVSEEALVANPSFPLALRYLVASLGQMGRVAEARQALTLLLRFDGDMIEVASLFHRLFVPEAAAHLLDGFRLAGIVS